MFAVVVPTSHVHVQIKSRMLSLHCPLMTTTKLSMGIRIRRPKLREVYYPVKQQLC